MACPGDDGVEDGGGPVDGGEFVVASREAVPLFEVGRSAHDDVAVVDGVERRRSSASLTATLPVPDLIRWFRDDGDDAALAQVGAIAREE